MRLELHFTPCNKVNPTLNIFQIAAVVKANKIRTSVAYLFILMKKSEKVLNITNETER